MPKFRSETELQETEIGTFCQRWEKRRIAEIGSVVTGKTPPTGSKVFWGGKYPFVTPTDIPDYDVRYSYRVERYLSEEWREKAESLLLPKDAVCFVCIGSTIGKLCILREPSFTNQQMNSVIVDGENDPKFVYYLLRCNQWRIKEEYGGGGAAKDIINKSTFEQMDLYCPQLDEQKSIAEVLSWFDELIENKEHQNEVLDGTAAAIFRNWFVNFEPFKDGEFATSVLGEIPKGWNARCMREVAEFRNGFSYKGEEKYGQTAGYIFITLNNIAMEGGFKLEYSRINSNRISSHQFLSDGDLVMANTDMTQDAKVIGSPAIVVLPYDYNGKAVYSHHITKVMPRDNHLKLFLYVFLKATQEENTTFSTGTNVLGLDMDNFRNNKLVIIPAEPILQKFDSLVRPLFDKIALNQKQIMVLRKIRNALMPLLVLGKLRVEAI